MFDDLPSLASVLLRFFHIAYAMLWLGVLFFFALVNGPFQAQLDDATKAKINPQLLLRGMRWARSASLHTVMFGWALFAYKYGTLGLLFAEGRTLTNRAQWILAGGCLGTVMWFNVWFIIYPRYRQLLMGLHHGRPVPDAAALVKTAATASKVNLFATGPLLFAMIVPNNYPGWPPIALALCTALGMGFWYVMLKWAYKMNPLR